MLSGADKNEIVFNIYRSADFNKVKFWGEIIKSMKLDKEGGFVWAAIPQDVFNSYDRPLSGKETAASQFTPIVQNTDFGMVMVEEKEKVLAVSLRSRKDFDVSKIAQELGGGGHREASGVKIYDLSFDEAVEKVLQTARKFARKK
jgi:phosphoesterase RecJ-like protein